MEHMQVSTTFIIVVCITTALEAALISGVSRYNSRCCSSRLKLFMALDWLTWGAIFPPVVSCWNGIKSFPTLLFCFYHPIWSSRMSMPQTSSAKDGQFIGIKWRAFSAVVSALWNILLPEIRMHWPCWPFRRPWRSGCVLCGSQVCEEPPFPVLVMLTSFDDSISWLLIASIFLFLYHFNGFHGFYDCSLPRATGLRWKTSKYVR